MNPKELWIGDRLKLKVTGEIGKFQGITKDGLLLLRIRGIERAYPIGKFYDETFNDVFEERHFSEEKNPEMTDSHMNNFVDLHIDSNDQKLIGNWPGAEIYHQKSKFVKFMKRAKRAGLSYVDVIHGKGSGALKSEVINLVEHWKLRHSEINPGSTRVWLG